MKIVNRPVIKDKTGFVVQGGPNAGATLVKKDRKSGQWAPVEKFERSVGDLELSNGYGFWKDKHVERGVVFVDTIRKKDGIIQPDEVTTVRDAKDYSKMIIPDRGDPTYQTRTSFGLNVQETPQGTLVMLEEQWKEHPRW